MIMEFIESPIIYQTSSYKLAIMEQAFEINIHNKNRKRGRHIKKAPKRLSNQSIHPTPNGYTHKRVRFMQQRQSFKKISQVHRKRSNWQHCLKDWVPFNSKSLSRPLAQLESQLPSLSSIDQLFSLASQEFLEENTDLSHLLRYSKISTLLSHPHGQTILLKHSRVGALGVYLGEQGTESRLSCGVVLSQSQTELVEKRLMFMEKLKGNESKYANSLGRMSQISKELAFTYRSYLQARNEIMTNVDFFTRKDVPIFSSENRISHRYAELLIVKNLNHTFGSLDLDPYNYFKLREHLETDRVHEFQNISSFEDLEIFIQKRKPKRGRRLALSTACSVCLSDYYELNNPLRTCSSCGLRAHKLCYCFDHSRCGYCAYQKLERPLKQTISWCFICRKPGLMVLKLTQCHYAHGFCLLVHGLWRTTSHSNVLPCNSSMLDGAIERTEESLCNCNQNMGTIEFLNPFQNQSFYGKNQNSTKTERKARQSRKNDEIREEQEELAEKEIEELENLMEKKYQEDLSVFDMEHDASINNQGCHRCGIPFYKDYFLTCQICGHHYHALCSFLAGFKMQLEEGQFRRKVKSGVKINCCDPECPRVGWNRRFKLNYQRCVFGLQACELEEVPFLWEQ